MNGQREPVRADGSNQVQVTPAVVSPVVAAGAPAVAPAVAEWEVNGRWETRIGELAVYPGHGVARIEDLKRQEICGQTCEFLVLRMMSGDSRILIPLGKVNEVGLRPLMGEREAARIWKILKTRPKDKPGRGQTWIRQFREYQERIKTGSIFELAEVLRDLLILQGEKELSFGEHRVLDAARTLLCQELAAVQSREATDVAAEIKAAVR